MNKHNILYKAPVVYEISPVCGKTGYFRVTWRLFIPFYALRQIRIEDAINIIITPCIDHFPLSDKPFSCETILF